MKPHRCHVRNQGLFVREIIEWVIAPSPLGVGCFVSFRGFRPGRAAVVVGHARGRQSTGWSVVLFMTARRPFKPKHAALPSRNETKPSAATTGEGVGRWPFHGGAVAHRNINGKPDGVLRAPRPVRRGGPAPCAWLWPRSDLFQHRSGRAGVYHVQRLGEINPAFVYIVRLVTIVSDSSSRGFSHSLFSSVCCR